MIEFKVSLLFDMLQREQKDPIDFFLKNGRSFKIPFNYN